MEFRPAVLRRDPMCKACNRALSTDADHIVPIQVGGTDDMSNFHGLCHNCHSRKTQRTYREPWARSIIWTVRDR